MSPAPAAAGLTLGRLCEQVGGTLEGPADLAVTGVAGLEEAGAGDLSFLANPKYRGQLETTKAGAVLIAPGVEAPPGLAVVRVADPYAALMRVARLFDPGPPAVPVGVHPTAVVSSDATLGEGVGVGPHAVIEAGATIGARTRIAAGAWIGPGARIGRDGYVHPGAYVGRGCLLGDRVILNPGAVVGSDGFGYAPVDGHYLRIPQLGIVEIGDDVEIGANACVDRATLGRTRIGRGTKIDNLVQIAHNVAVGEDTVIAAQAGIAGSTRIGNSVRLGGQAGVLGHIRVGDGASVGAQAGVIGDVTPSDTVSGYPARPHREAMRVEAAVRRLPQLARRVRALEAEVHRAESSRSPREDD